MTVNKVFLLGNLGRDPELKYAPTGGPVCNFTLATKDVWNDKQGHKQEKTEWHRIVVFGKMGELCSQFLAKGRSVFVEGRLQTREWEDKQGARRYMTEIVANDVRFLGKPDPVAEPEKNTKSFMEKDYVLQVEPSFTADDIPF